MKKTFLCNLLFLMTTFSSYACLHIRGCDFPHEYDPAILAEVDADETEATDNYLYDFSLWNEDISPEVLFRAQDIHLQKATRYFDLKRFDKCLEHIRIVEKHFQGPHGHLNKNETDKGKILAYKAYCLMYLKKFGGATEAFEDLINFLTTSKHYKPCLFASYFYHAYCLHASGHEKKAKEKIQKLVNMNLVDKNQNSLVIYDQPCFHPNGINEKHLLRINQEIAEATGQQILALNNQFYPKIALCNNNNERKEECSENCMYLAGVAAYAAAYIPQKHIQAGVLFAIVIFQVECNKCCVDGLGSDNCLRTLKNILSASLNAFNQEALDGL